MEVAAQGFLNSIRGSTKFWLILCLYSPRVKQIRVRLNKFSGLGPQGSAMVNQIHLGGGFGPHSFIKGFVYPNPQGLGLGNQNPKGIGPRKVRQIQGRGLLGLQGKARPSRIGWCATFVGFLERIGFVADLGLLEQDASRNRFQNHPFRSPCNQD